MDDIDDTFEEFVRKKIGSISSMIEATIEASIVGGKCGVKICRSRYEGFISVAVDSSIPYGEVHEFLID